MSPCRCKTPGMTLDEYQASAMSTAVYNPYWKVIYPALKLAGEAGEVAEKVGKRIRGDQALQDDATFAATMVAELGDVLWYVAALARDLGVTLEQVAAGNLTKLSDRASRGVLKGSGDER